MTAIVSLKTVKSIYTPSHQGFIRIRNCMCSYALRRLYVIIVNSPAIYRCFDLGPSVTARGHDMKKIDDFGK